MAYDNSLMGTSHSNYTAAAGIAGTSEQTLMTYTLPANALRRDGMRLKIKGWALTGANGNNKTFKLYFGSANMSSGVITGSAKQVRLELDVIRSGSATQVVLGQGQQDSTALAQTVTAATEDSTAAITIKLTGTGGTSGVDCTAEWMVVEEALEP